MTAHKSLKLPLRFMYGSLRGGYIQILICPVYPTLGGLLTDAIPGWECHFIYPHNPKHLKDQPLTVEQ